MEKLTRREFTRGALGSVLAYSLLETLFENDAFGSEVKPVTGKWLLSILMMAGRLEIFTVLLLFTPGFWKR